MARRHRQHARRVRYPELRVRTTRVVGTELDALCEGELSREIDRVRLASHVTFPGIATALAPTAGLFLAADAPPIFPPLVPVFTLAMPQSLPAALINLSAS